jgi:hypothetical protein
MTDSKKGGLAMQKQNVQRQDSADYDVITERKTVLEFLQQRGLTTDPLFFDQITTGDIIEVYAAPANVQIYQNQEFLKLCSYTPEQMSTTPFPMLFWRSEEANVALLRRVAQVMLNETKCVPWDVATHDLVESLHPRKRTFEMNMGYISPCFDIKTKSPRAWASTLKVSLIFEWQENLA